MDLSILAIDGGWGGQLLRGLGVTVALATVSGALGCLLGLAAAVVEISRLRLAARVVAGWNAILRSLPELLVIFAVYYGFSLAFEAALAPFGFTGFVGISAFWAGVIAISLIIGAYCAQVFRGALNAVPSGPIEAARALGLRDAQLFLLVRLPLAVRYALPGLVNLLVVTLKITPLVSAVGLEDLMRTAGDAGENTKRYMTFYVTSLVLYLVLAALISSLNLRVEKRLSAYRIG